MRIVLEVINGPDKGRKTRLAANQTITVGRTEWADFVIPSDPRLSSKHFAIETTRDDCQLRDLGSANGTMLNNAPCALATLKDGDKIAAGGCQFLVRLEGGAKAPSSAPASAAPSLLCDPIGAAPAARLCDPVGAEPAGRLCDPVGADPSGPLCDSVETHPLLAPVSAGPRSAAPVTGAPPTSGIVEIMVATGRNGLHHARCPAAQLPPRDLIGRLVRKTPLHLIVDFSRLGQPRPAALDPPQFLFDWLPDPSASSPVVISPCEPAMAGALVEAGWGKDAIVCLFSNHGPDRLVRHLRAQARGPRDSLLGYCWPSVLGPLLANFRKERAEQLIEGIDMVLVEDAEAPDQWQMFSFNNLQAEFQKLGLRATTAPDAPAG